MTANLKSIIWSENGVILALALFKLLLHLATNFLGGYGIFRDELYYLACAEHPDIGYVDHPPLSIWILSINRWLLGDSLFALRFLPAVIGAVVVFISGLIVREMGGGRFAQAIACVATIVSLIKLAMDSVYSMNTFDHLLWALAVFYLVKLAKNPEPQYWLLVSVVLGLGLLNKIGVLWLGTGIFVGLLATSMRSSLKTRWPYVAGGIAFVIFLPYIMWNIMHDFAHLEFIRNASSGKYSGLSALSFTRDQLLLQNPFTAPIWIAGLMVLFVWQRLSQFTILGFVYVTSFVVLVLNGHSKAEYLAPAYVMLFAAGGIWWEQLLSKQRLQWVKPAYTVILFLSAILLAPFVLTILPVQTYISYSAKLGMAPSSPEGKQLAELPQFYADMFGWEEKARDVAAVFHSLPLEEQKKCAILADNYGRCAAIDFYGPKYGLPKSIGRHNNYWIWGPGEYDASVVIVLGGRLADKHKQYDSVEVAGVSTCQYCMPYENNLRIFVCRGPRFIVAERWPQAKHFE